MEATTPKVLFTTLKTSRFNYAPMLEKARSSIASLKGIILLDEIGGAPATSNIYTSYDDLIQMAELSDAIIARLEQGVKPSDVLNLQFTSGSTGRPKSAALTHNGMVNSARYIGSQMEIDASDSIVIPVPLFHAFGLIIGE
jgi:acyl-CoA synthetase (AMP-forming)/AMP-acid ligase II